MKKFIYISVLFLLGCATHFQSLVMTSDKVKPSGEYVFVDVYSFKAGNSMEGPVADIIRDEAKLQLRKMDYHVTEKRDKANFALIFFPESTYSKRYKINQTFFVPFDDKETETTPSYNIFEQEEAKAQIKKAQPEKIIRTEWIFVGALSLSGDYRGMPIFEGNVLSKETNTPFFQDEKLLRKGVRHILKKSLLQTYLEEGFKYSRETAFSDKEKYCVYNPGFATKNGTINSITRQAFAKGFRLNDKILSINEVNFTLIEKDPKQVSAFYKGKPLDYEVLRDGKKIKLSHRPIIYCI